MTNMISHTVNTDALLTLKTALVKETVQSLLMLKKHQFDLSTEKGIDYAVNCTVDSLLQQKIKNNEIQVLEQGNSNEVIQ
ncbi:hypothetical protein [Acinetobacter celticus]|uniref:Uncharacterized protein n=1 Tax=Acinetobacter celticus TaxID=1891224 RepID=A0A1C3D0L4_9GAMM|nr:hypothetical protein [Acinetobacter celticus]ODA14538.1 hypothetical protein BBP83_01685 [Acinetobacter celticus]